MNTPNYVYTFIFDVEYGTEEFWHHTTAANSLKEAWDNMLQEQYDDQEEETKQEIHEYWLDGISGGSILDLNTNEMKLFSQCANIYEEITTYKY